MTTARMRAGDDSPAVAGSNRRGRRTGRLRVVEFGEADVCQRGFRRSHGPVPRRAAGSLLPDAGVRRGGRGPGPGDVSAGVAVLRRVRGPLVGADLALPDRDERVPD